MNERNGMLRDDEKSLAMAAHLLGIVTGFVGPLILYLVLDDKPGARSQAGEALNFQITLLIGYVVGAVLSLVCIGYFLLLGLGIAAIVLGVLAAVSASDGKPYRYPWTLRLVG